MLKAKGNIYIDGVKLDGVITDLCTLSQNLNDSILSFSNAMSENLLPVFQSFYEVSGTFTLMLDDQAKREYLKHHKRLPGSEKTKRLRKKRRTRVLKWYWNHIYKQLEVI